MPRSIRFSIESLSKSLGKEQLYALGFPSTGQLELSQVEEKVWILSLPNGQAHLGADNDFTLTSLHEKVLRLLKTHKTADLIEGRFEKLLSPNELQAFNELKQRGRIVCMKSSPKFDKGIYREPPASAIHPSSFSIPIQEKPVEEYSLLHDGFMVLRSEGAAKAASYDLGERIKNGEVKGIKSFDGFYYIIENALLEKFSPILQKMVQTNKKVGLSQIAEESHVPLVLARIVLEFGKEEGNIIEKQKNLFAWVG